VSGPRVSSGVDSEQVVATPREFLDAVERRFGDMDIDLAATMGNSVAANWIGPNSQRGSDSLKEDWARQCEVSALRNMWLNPPYGDIGPWAKKCAETPVLAAHRRIFLLVPLTTANWACDYVHGKALVLGLTPRIKFVGHKTAFPKDLILAVYGERPGFEVWRWKASRSGTSPAASSRTEGDR
jgi:phage N-6-adenine-methyltransferase